MRGGTVIRVGVGSGRPEERAPLEAALRDDPGLRVVADPWPQGLDVLVLAGAGSPVGALLDWAESPFPGPAPALLVIGEPGRLYDSYADLGFADMGFRAIGVLPAGATAEEVRTAVHALAAGLMVGTPELLGALFTGEELPSGRQAAEQLTPREGEVLQLLALGLANKEISARLAISEHTVKFHLSSIFSKLGATNRVEAVRQGIRSGLLEI